MLPTNWYVLTGGPGCGKTKIIEALAFQGFSVRPESARLYIDEEMSRGKTLLEARADAFQFQSTILGMKTQAEANANPDELIFWDRGMPDSIVYMQEFGGDTRPSREASLVREYKGVFLPDPLPHYEADYARMEDGPRALRIHSALESIYTELGYSVVRIPVMPISERVQFILSHIGETALANTRFLFGRKVDGVDARF